MCRSFLIIVFSVLSLVVNAQPVTADLSLSNNQVFSAAGGEVNANILVVNQVVRIKVVVGNFVTGTTVPGGHVRLKIGLGNGLVLNPTFNLATAPLNAYFNWTYDLSGAQPQIIGNSIAPLPSDFAEFADFELKCTSTTTSTISFNFLIANPQGTLTPVSDPASANNACSNGYSVSTGITLPVNFINFNAVKKDCEVNVLWNTENQLNVKKFEIEVSKDNGLFKKIGETAAKNSPAYTYAFGLTKEMQASTVYIRLKSIDADGSFRYSKIISVIGNCGSKWQLVLFPNPVSSESLVTVMAKEGIFDGRYKISIISNNGQLVQQKELTLSGARLFPLSVVGFSSGKYHVKIVSLADEKTTVLEFEKL